MRTITTSTLSAFYLTYNLLHIRNKLYNLSNIRKNKVVKYFYFSVLISKYNSKNLNFPVYIVKKLFSGWGSEPPKDSHSVLREHPQAEYSLRRCFPGDSVLYALLPDLPVGNFPAPANFATSQGLILLMFSSSCSIRIVL